ncbi:MAG: hypothetical protein R2709_06420 [Marmoricola sp.]
MSKEENFGSRLSRKAATLLAIMLAGVKHRQAVGSVRFDRMLSAGISIEQLLGQTLLRQSD